VVSSKVSQRSPRGDDPARDPGGEGKSPRGGKAHEGRCFLAGLNASSGNKDACRVPGLEVEASANHKKVAALERVFDSASGIRP
jgi:hypothetical protein